MSEYMYVLILAVSIPFVLSFYPPLEFYRHPKALIFTLGVILLVFGAWDVFAVFRQHWYFDPLGVWPVRIVNLPLEEVLFFIIIPFCCIFTWEVLGFLTKKAK